MLIGIAPNGLHNLIWQFIAACYMQFIFGFHIYVGLYREIFKTKSLGMNALVFIGTLIPFCYSLYLACLI